MITPEELETRLTRILKPRITGRNGIKPRWNVRCDGTGYNDDILVVFAVDGCAAYKRVYGATHPIGGIVGNLMNRYRAEVDQLVMNRISRVLWEITDHELVHVDPDGYVDTDIPWCDVVATKIVTDPRHEHDMREWVNNCADRAREYGYANMPYILESAYRAYWEDR